MESLDMEVIYDWKWGPMRVERSSEFPDLITGIHWSCTAKQKSGHPDILATQSGFIPMPTPDPSTYVNIDQIGPETLKSWIEDSISRKEIEEKCRLALANRLNPSVMQIPMADLKFDD
jgi:hypothetical protein